MKQNNMLKLSNIKNNAANPRTIRDEKFAQLVQSLRTFPQMMEKRPMVCVKDEDKKIYPLGGNMRLRAIEEIISHAKAEVDDAVWSSVRKVKALPAEWVLMADEWNEEQRREFVIKDNVGYGEWDWDMLANEWDMNELQEWGLDIPDFLEKVEEEEGENNIPEAPAITAKGDVYELNNHRLVCGSSCEADDINTLMLGKKADLIFTDPPYDLDDLYTNLIIDQAKEDCHVFIMDGDKRTMKRAYEQNSFRKFFVCDFRIARMISNSQPMQRTTLIAEFLKGKGKFNNMKDGFTTLIESAVHHKSFENTGFNQAKKVELPETFVLHYSKPNELVCDFFGGAGSTLIACEKNNRNCYVMECEPKNADIIVARWINYMKKNEKLFDVKINGKKCSNNLFKLLKTNNLVET